MGERNHFERNRDHDLIARYYCEGKSGTEIAKLISISPARVYEDLKILRKYWKETISHRLEEELAKLDNLERVYWEAWNRSIRNALTTTTKLKSIKSGDQNIDMEAERTKREEQQVGDPRFLQGIQDCIKQRRELLGLDQPKKSEVEIKGEPYKVYLNFDPDQV